MSEIIKAANMRSISFLRIALHAFGHAGLRRSINFLESGVSPRKEPAAIAARWA